MHGKLGSLVLLLAFQVSADTLLVVEKHDSRLAFVDTASMKVTARIATGDSPHEVAVSDDGRLAVVTNYGTDTSPGSSLTVVDVATRKELRRVNLPGL
jgi:YVTN family beta-propeller protein